MVCQYSRPGRMSSKKQERAPELGGARGDTLAVGTVTMVVDGYWPRPKPCEVPIRAAKVAKASRFTTPAKLYLYDTLLKRLAQDLEDMTAELAEFIQEERLVVGQRHFARHEDVSAANQPHIRDDVMRGAKRTGGDQGRAVAGEAGDAVDTGSLKGLGEGHRRQNGGEPPCQYRLACPRRPSRRILWAERLHDFRFRHSWTSPELGPTVIWTGMLWDR
jgi:hypothetical protein